MPPDTIETDLVIMGGGFMGLAIAHQAALKGLRSVVIEKNKITGPHYMTGLLSPRADYMPFDIESARFAAHECAHWQEMFPSIVKPTRFLIPINDNTHHGFHSLKPLLELYDQITKERLGKLWLSQPKHYKIDQATLETMEPNLRKGFFREALAFHELTADPNLLLKALSERIASLGNYCKQISIKDISAYVIDKKRIRKLDIITKDGGRFSLVNRLGQLTFINAAGPWMGEVARGLGIKLPLEFSLGIQMTIPIKHFFRSGIITFTNENKYLICLQRGDHLQIGPSNTPFIGKPDNIETCDKDAGLLMETFQNIVEPEKISQKPEIKSAGLRVKMKLPRCPDTNRPFIFHTDYENYFAIYPGKASLAFMAANEILAKISRRKIYTHSLNGTRLRYTRLRLYMIWLQSVIRTGWHFSKYWLKLPLKKLKPPQ